jgi:hypothetical protein
MHHPPRARRDQRGNILFIILLAVALFAALNYAVMQSMQSGGKDGTSEKAQADVAALISQLSVVENELQRFLLSNGLSIDKIDMGGINSPFCVSSNCNLSSSYSLPVWPETYCDPVATFWCAGNNFQLSNNFILGKIPNVGTEKADLILKIKGIQYEMCLEINKISGLSNGAELSDANYVRYNSIGIDDSYAYENAPTNYSSIKMWCLAREDGPYGSYLFYVLYPR